MKSLRYKYGVEEYQIHGTPRASVAPGQTENGRALQLLPQPFQSRRSHSLVNGLALGFPPNASHSNNVSYHFIWVPLED